MASPPEISCTNLNGHFVMNKTLSDSLEPMLVLQGISWFVRKAIGLATPTVTVKEYQQDGVWHIDIVTHAAGLSTQKEDRVLDWSVRDHQDRIFGNVKGQARMYKTGELEMGLKAGTPEDKEFLDAKKLRDGSSTPGWLDEQHVQSYVINVDKGYGWEAEQDWGFEEVDGKRYYTRRIVCRKGDKVERLRIVYDYTGPVKKGEDDGLAYSE